MNKKKFFLVTTIPNSLNFFSGQYHFLKNDFDLTAISSVKNTLEEFGKTQGIKVHFIPMVRNISLFKDFYCLFCFILYFYKERPYIVHGNTPKGSLLSMLAAWMTKVPVRVYMCHGLRYQGFTGFKRKLLMFMEKVSCYCATDILCVSKGVNQFLHEDKITNKKTVVIWNGSVKGIDVERFNPHKAYDKEGLRKQLGINEGDYVLSFIGRINNDKGINELVEAFCILQKKHPMMKLLLVGRMDIEENPISDKVRNTINKNDGIIATGRQSDVPAFLSITDLFVFPSYREGFGLSLMEAGAMGVPAIASDIIGCNEVIINEETGLLIPPHSSSAIVAAVDRVFNDRALYEKFHVNCRDSIVGRYEQNKLFGQYRNYYLSI